MKSFRLVLLVVVAMVFTTTAFAWPACSGNWVQVAKGTKSAPGAGGIGAVLVENGQTFECEKPSGGGSSNTSSSTSSSESSSASSSTSASSSVIGPISVKGGDSTNNNTANGGAGGNSNQSQSATSSGGNNSNNTTVNEAKIPVNTAYAAVAIPTMGCFKGFGAGAQTSGFGASFGGGKVDENCEILEVARSFGIAGSWDAYCQVMITNKYAKKAGVTWAECMKRVTEAPAPVAVAPPLPQPAPAPQIIYVEPPAAKECRECEMELDHNGYAPSPHNFSSDLMPYLPIPFPERYFDQKQPYIRIDPPVIQRKPTRKPVTPKTHKPAAQNCPVVK